MANTEQNIKVISKNNSGFPEYLDFERLRTEGIAYLGQLSGKIWTDHNVHDPGITILEVLCYALLDLGYRTNLPVADIFTPDPAAVGKDNNFFSPAEILSCNPLTIIDYRKLLIDIDGVRNAWLTVATDQKDFCKRGGTDSNGVAGNTDCDEFLNGLYHVYIEPEKNIERDFKNDLDAKTYLDSLYTKVKERLMAHRNFCEDFADVHLLCKFQLGVCANIELNADADPEKVYLSIAQQLRTFFSPSPVFYTLQQLLDKNKPIDEIFAGRPYNLTESHGFIDTDELTGLKLKKEIHLSDVYSLILGIEGVQKINKLDLKNCKDALPNFDWKFKLPENHVLDFSMDCSGFQFTKNGLPFTFDTKKYEGLFQIDWNTNGKFLYQSPSPYLDLHIPKGIYHSDLDEYSLLQNDFPDVYGIAEGGLPDEASDLRKAQALQLKGYLLFFDQLLSGYLSQLKNIRSLFAMASPADQAQKHTYFLNQLEAIPGLNHLLRFAAGAEQSNATSEQGSILVHLVPKIELDKLISLNLTKPVNPTALAAFTFSSLTSLQIALSELKDDFYTGSYRSGFLNEDSPALYYYLYGSSDQFALISHTSFKTIADAKLQLSTVTYIGTFEQNYRIFTNSIGEVSFNLEMNMVSASDYLQHIMEDDDLYAERRNTFLDHLLARFAERFTDLALLSYGQQSRQQASSAAIKAKENFLVNYDEISANRGKAYDYAENNWNNANLSGFENEAKFLSGIENKQLHSLCNFVVATYDEQYVVNLKIAGQPYFALQEKFDSRAEAEEIAHRVFTALSDPSRLKVHYLNQEKMYGVQLRYDDRNTVFFSTKYKNPQEAETVSVNLNRMFSGVAASEDIFISNYRYHVYLVDYKGDILSELSVSFVSEPEAHAAEQQLVPKINEAKNWLSGSKLKSRTGTLQFNKTYPEQLKFIDVKSFKIDINNTIVGKPDKFTYELLDNANSFKFYPERDFGNSKEARQHCYFVLTLAGNENNYQISGKTDFKLNLVYNGETEASCDSTFLTESEAREAQQQIIRLIREREFTLKTEAVASGWKFNYRLGYAPEADYLFTSADEYSSPEEAMNHAKAFHQGIPSLQIEEEEEIALAPVKKNSKIPRLKLTQNVALSTHALIRNAFEEQKTIALLKKNDQPKAFKGAVEIDESNGAGRYVYRLVDKDHVMAFYGENYPDKEQAELSRRKVARMLRQNLRYLQLCLGGDIIHQVAGKGSSLYRYQLKAHNYFYTSGELSGEEMVLFESTMTYTSKEMAFQAFEENYFYVLELASVPENYGRLIGLQEDPAAFVFIPEATRIEIQNHGEGDIVQLMSELIRSYPIKRIGYGSEQFNDLFCGTADPAATDPCKTGKSRQQVYYFVTGTGGKESGQWYSLKYYQTVEECSKEFLLFIALLKYPGNLYVDCDPCAKQQEPVYKIYLREVLAESYARFISEADAWGKEGLEKFICAVQSELGFHHYQKREDCCYTFYLSCGEDLVVHPCVYPTQKRRNEVLSEIYEQFNKFVQEQSYALRADDKELLLLDEAGNPFARQTITGQMGCELVMRLIDVIVDVNSFYQEKGGELFLLDSAGNLILQSYTQDYGMERWKETLKLFACYFPVLRTKNETTGVYRYHIELRFPGFTACADEVKEEDPCGCNGKGAEPVCELAWKSSCCFASCEEAMQALDYIREVLGSFENYQPVVGCTPDSFGIALNFNNRKTAGSLSANRRVISGERIAFNPQCYESVQMVCSAVERTKYLTNAEGLHAVEHILLRPGSAADCECRDDLYCGESKRQCDYQWVVTDDDPCSEARNVCFIPGSDPYSFIATVVLPAWPARFRAVNSRLLMEDILYRLAPAHVLLRVLWLAPHDFCCFESKYKNWRRWLAEKKTCAADFLVCDFLEFLFRRNYECMDDCERCLPGEIAAPQTHPCLEVKTTKEDQNRFLNQVNKAFCWNPVQCNGYEFIACEQVKLERENKINVNEQEAFKNKRIAMYRSSASHIGEHLKKNVTLPDVLIFLDEKELTAEKFETIVTTIIRNQKPLGKGAVALNQHQVLHLLENVVGYMLDNLCFNEDGDFKKLSTAFEKMRKAKIDLAAVYNHWDALEMKKYLPDLSIENIKSLFTGSNMV